MISQLQFIQMFSIVPSSQSNWATMGYGEEGEQAAMWNYYIGMDKDSWRTSTNINSVTPKSIFAWIMRVLLGKSQSKCSLYVVQSKFQPPQLWTPALKINILYYKTCSTFSQTEMCYLLDAFTFWVQWIRFYVIRHMLQIGGTYSWGTFSL